MGISDVKSADPQRRSSARDPWLLLAFLLPAAAVLFSLLPTEDLAYQIRSGNLAWQAGAIIRSDLFTFTMQGRTWLNQQWGAQLLLASTYALGGWRGLIVLRALIVGSVVGVTYLRVRGRIRSSVTAVVVTFVPFLVCVTLPGSLAMRPQILALPLFITASILLSRRQDHPRALWWVPVIGVAWANVHGSFVLLIALCAIAFMADLTGGRRWTVSGAVLAASLAAPLVTPWGFDTYHYVFDLATDPVIRAVIDEWRPMWHQSPAGWLFLSSIATALFLLARGGWARLMAEDKITFIVFSVAAAASGRAVVWWALAVPPAVVGGLVGAPAASSWTRLSARVAQASVIAITVVGLIRVSVTQPQERLLSDAPVGLATALRAVSTSNDRVFEGWWFSWLEFAIPEDRTFVDARVEVFPTSVWDDYFRISSADPGWQDALDQWQIDVVVASRVHQSGLIAALAVENGWREVYADDLGVIFVRSAG
jgi:hypothetical protein